MLPLNDLAAIPLNNLRPNYLAVVEEKDAEAEVEELSKALKDTEKTLEEVRIRYQASWSLSFFSLSLVAFKEQAQGGENAETQAAA